MTDTDTALQRLDSFLPEERTEALAFLKKQTAFPEAGPLFNLHCHSFFSYNADGWSPSHIAYECAKRGLCATGLCDFDVLDGVEEFLTACRLLGIRGTAHMETRAYVPEWKEREISSPGEPGVTYIMGCGFGGVPAEDSEAGRILASYRKGAQDRNLALIARINASLPDVALDYEKEVQPLTPRGVATERHIVRAYREKAIRVFPDIAVRSAYFAPLLKTAVATFPELERDIPKLENQIRSALAKNGGIGYIQPAPESFPLAGDFFRWVAEACGIPTIAWLDGMSAGESDVEAYLDEMVSFGCRAVNIIPERNWNLKDPAKAKEHQKKLDDMVRGCVKRDLPVVIGTEMNKGGLPFVDDITQGVLSSYAETFRQGMLVMVGQSRLAAYADAPYCGEKACAAFPDIPARNAFFASVGKISSFSFSFHEELLAAGKDKAWSLLADAALSVHEKQ